MKHLPGILAFSVFLAVLQTLRADVAPSPIFSDHMVLQRGKPVSIWGRADTGEKITVTYRKHGATTTAGADGKWELQLPDLEAGEPAELVVEGKNTLRFADVVVGEVWICSGQSNMQWPVKSSKDAGAEIAAATHPGIRLIQISRVFSEKPLDKIESAKSWQRCSPESVPEFSAVGYYFGRAIHGELKVPVGLIDCSWGGTCIETWISPEGLATDPAAARVRQFYADMAQRYPATLALYQKRKAKWAEDVKQAAAEGKPRPAAPRVPRAPTNDRNAAHHIYNGMIHPMLPLAFRGVVWYQGEANAARYDQYRTLFPSMITQWRKDFAQGDFPFYFVQLANFKSDATGMNYAFQREAQAAALKLPNTGMAVAMDCGEINEIHFPNKQDVGARLARLALARTYGFPVHSNGPVLAKAEPVGGGYRLKFDHADGGLVIKAPGPEAGEIAFQIAGEDKIFHHADARVETPDTLFVTSPAVKKPVAIRYAWHNTPAAILYNNAGFPAPAFRTDNWPGPAEGK